MASKMPCGLNPCSCVSGEYIRDLVTERYNIKSFTADDSGGWSVKANEGRLFHLTFNSTHNTVLLLFDLVTERELIDADAREMNDLLQRQGSPAQIKINFGEHNRVNIYQLINVEHFQDELFLAEMDDFLSACYQLYLFFAEK